MTALDEGSPGTQFDKPTVFTKLTKILTSFGRKQTQVIFCLCHFLLQEIHEKQKQNGYLGCKPDFILRQKICFVTISLFYA